MQVLMKGAYVVLVSMAGALVWFFWQRRHSRRRADTSGNGEARSDHVAQETSIAAPDTGRSVESTVESTFTPPSADAIPLQVQAGQFAYYFRYPGPDGKFGPLHPDKISETNQNIFGLDVDHDPDSKDDIVTAEMAIPVNKEIHLLMHSKDVGHSFYVRELRVQQDFVPGLDVSLHFTATKVGKYEIVCTQLCGLGHYNMKAYLYVYSQEDFDNWLKKEAAMQ
jgi:cytochrome c oxidase subunit 2